MFYSQTFLARKGPLGVVWCAAHLQHRLKKSHYLSVDVSSTVEKIMYPEVPLALRMSSHLLCGVVRVYSKQVDYLLHDSNIALSDLRKAFVYVEVDLPEDARQAPVESVTLPQTFNLEDYIVEDDVNYEDMDDRQKRVEEITLSDQFLAETGLYIAISFDEDIFPEATANMDLPKNRASNDIGDVALLERIPNQISQAEVRDGTVEVRDMVLDDQTEIFESTMELQDFHVPGNDATTRSPGIQAENIQDSPEIERIRKAGPEMMLERDPSLHPYALENITEQVQCRDGEVVQNENHTPILEEILDFERHSSGQRQSEQKDFGVPEDPGVLDGRVSVHSPPQFELQPTPPEQQPQRAFRTRQQARPRKRKLFDKATVLTNKFMKRSLQDSKDLKRKKPHVPESALGIWRLKRSLRKEHVFDEPIFTGTCVELRDIFRAENIASKPLLASTTESAGKSVAESPSREAVSGFEPPRNALEDPVEGFVVPDSPARETEAVTVLSMAKSPYHSAEANVEDTVGLSSRWSDADVEIEKLRDSNFEELVHSPPGFSLSSQCDLDSGVRYESGATNPTPSLASSAATSRSEAVSPRSIPEDLYGMSAGLPDIPESDEELTFLDSPSKNPSPQTNAGISSLSVRTRALARYLKGCSSASPGSEGPSDHLSLKKILKGKTRKLCARMFFETLVLRENNLVEVQQDNPYGDITLKLCPALAKAVE